ISFYMNTLAAPDLRWEKTATYEIATDWGFFENRLNASLGYFYRLTSDKITTIAVPSSSGVSSVLSNNGSINNQGLEFSVDYNIIQSKDIQWKVGANVTYVKSKVVKLPTNSNENNRQGGTQVYDPKSGGLIWVGGLQEGQEPYQIATWIFDGIWQSDEEIAQQAGNLYIASQNNYSSTSRPLIGPNLKPGVDGIPSNAVPIAPGDARYKDLNGDNIIDFRDREVIGSAIPKWTGGITSSFNYKGISLYVALDYALGYYNYNTTDVWFLGAMQGEWNVPTKVYDTWTPENPGATYPKFYGADQTGAGNYARESTLWWEKGDYLAFRVLTLSYEIPKRWLEKCSIENLRVSATGQNLGYLTKNKFYSPESRNSNVVSGGAGYPLPKTFILSLSASF
ncbi:MAG: SusC/RagA family protein, partial [Phocaeicola sp.]